MSRAWVGVALVWVAVQVAMAEVPEVGLEPPALDTGIPAEDTGDGGWDTGFVPEDDDVCPPTPSVDTGDSGDTGVVWCADEKKTPEIVDLKKYPKDKDFADIPKAVADVIAQRCATCHNSASNKGNLQKYDRANKEFPPSTDKTAPVITLSEMLRRITQTEDQGKMPPPKGTASPAGTPLTADQLKTLQDWLEKNGAKK